MKFRITYNVYGMQFTAEADTIAKAYEYVRAIVQRENINFPDQERTLSEYMEILAYMKAGETKEYKMFVFNIEVINA